MGGLVKNKNDVTLPQVYGWKPDPYKSEDELDSDMSQNLARKIKSWPSSTGVGDLIWVECYGRVSRLTGEPFSSNLSFFVAITFQQTQSAL